MSAPTDKINKCFERIEKAGIRFDVPKSKLPEEVQKEIKMMSDNTYFVELKSDRDFKEYMNVLAQRRKTLQARFADKDMKFERFIPKNEVILPWNILKDGQGVYIQDVQAGVPMIADIKDITPFSERSEYIKLAHDIKNQWLKKSYPEADILPPYKSQTLYPDAHYITLRSEDGKLQAIANLEIQDDGVMWGRSLNTAPWNQGEHGQIQGCREAIIARMVSVCLETRNHTLKFATDKPENIKFYKSLGMTESGTRNLGGNINTVLKFDKESMETFLNKYQINLAF
jgi:hypothetical protein